MAAVSPQKKRLDDIEKSAEAIRRDYEQYFMGLIKRPPTTTQAQFAGMMRRIKEDELREWSTQDRFRFNQIHARFVSMERIWARELAQVESGTHRRDKMRLQQMKRRDAAKGDPAEMASLANQPPQSVSLDPLDSIDVDMDSFNEDSLAAPKPAPKPAAAAPRPAATPPRPASTGDLGGLSEQRLQQLYKVYMDAKRRTGEASSLSFEALRSQIAKQVPQIRQKHNCEAVDFKVVLKDGKAMLKAIPK